MSKTGREIITSTRVMYYILTFYRYDSAHIVLQLDFIHEVMGQYIFLTGYFPGQAFIWPQQGIYLLHLFTYHYIFPPQISLSVQQLKSLPSDCAVFYCTVI